MQTIEDSITVNRPLKAAYDQWTQFEEFPLFMQGVKEVTQLDAKRLHWRAEIAGKTKEWDAEIFEQIPDQRIAWRSIGGAKNSGNIHFTSLGDTETRVDVKLHYDPVGFVEHIGDVLGTVSMRVSADLRRFKEFIEGRPVPPEGWRGEIRGKEIYEAEFPFK